ncbi:muscarinic acetylcholine receptor M5b [Alosa sapidissima]|uniref:muscarinic acetylcholine receptor M5b n=1 Tax=Alosa sapidissima TaxID=34773 RepID=UPI001C087505|nr:muscarinic acetylcholine receptor M5b [Alosa sapidissima]XP_041952434.1 muscarinic acetylcholine receptor M5b [Alosa sapidissima]XP_041952435.1 muscarinic acetylcholine receptor M5b [Alosa sapidissima]XP_041952436.1 muscarinic acetylcholine receptor M5b [Alosa sapidissima]XP_041952437.1 muscarinic acetylcholine receptor M5b [Alosa sapidissima]
MNLDDLQNSTLYGNTSEAQTVPPSLWEVITIATVSAVVSLITVVGNILVLLSFKVNSQLKTVNNYYLLSLAFADLIIGVFSMNLYTSYILMGSWYLGNLACDLWLALDYVASNASVMNLLVISFDRYFSITRPLTYRAKRTPKRAGIMIGMAWLVSFILWAPPILCWQYFVGNRTVPPNQCHIQFFSEPVITFGTAIAAFYIPVSVMTILYCRIYKETEKRTKDLAELQGLTSTRNPDISRPPRTMIKSCFGFDNDRERTQASWSSSNQSNITMTTVCASRDTWAKNEQVTSFNSYTSSEDEERPVSATASQESCKSQALPGVSENGQLAGYSDDCYFSLSPRRSSQKGSKKGISYKFKPLPKEAGPQPSKVADNQTPLLPCPSQNQLPLTSSPSATATKPMDPNLKSQITKRKRMVLIKEKKAAQTLSAILLAFILTWTPYNIMVLISTFCSDCIPVSLWHLGYWLCYVNSTINPMCYALCNKTFQKTFKMLLLCKWRKNRGKEKLYWCGQNPVMNSKLT